jgi:Tol biopolymer transport system component
MLPRSSKKSAQELAANRHSFYLCPAPFLFERPVPMRFSKRFVASILTFSFCSQVTLLAQQKNPTQHAAKKTPTAATPKPATPLDEVMNTMYAARRFEQTAISPDGKKIAWVETLTGKDGAPDGNTAIYVADSDASAPPKRLSASNLNAARAEGGVAWSRDSKQITFLSDAVKPGQLQLYVAAAAGGPAKKLTNVKGLLASPAWSPDGKTIAVLFTENATRAAGPLVAETPQTGEIKDSYFEQRLALIGLATGDFRQISPADTYIYEFDWSPDGARFAVTAAQGNGDDNWYIAQLYSLDPGPLGLMKPVFKPPLQIANPAWSPDGKKIAFIAGLMSAPSAATFSRSPQPAAT